MFPKMSNYSLNCKISVKSKIGVNLISDFVSRGCCSGDMLSSVAPECTSALNCFWVICIRIRLNLKKCSVPRSFWDVASRRLQTQRATQQHSSSQSNWNLCTWVLQSLIDYFLGHFAVLRVRWRSGKRGQC